MYYFYLISTEANNGNVANPNAEPRMELGVKINTGKDNGYSGNEAIDNKDPHFGWDIGTFYVNGYTRSTVDTDNQYVFIKKLGDRVTLWFNLLENIYALQGNNKVYVCDDTNGYDRYFETPQTNFKRGTLIIRYTDYQGVRHEPVIYTDYLAACSTTGANTRVELFEEGDYEVALDYEIKDERGVNSYHNYRIFFKFKIRNGNCMAFPFDSVTKNELADGSITPNGFYLDLAQSRYLTIDVIRYSLKLSNGIYVQDSRNNSPAKDGETYTQEGVYQFTVRNLYTNAEDTSKTIYVGTAPIYRALARGIYSLDEINQMLTEGGILEDDGTITMPVPIEEEPEEVPEEQVVDVTDETENVEAATIDTDQVEVEQNESVQEAVVDETEDDTENAIDDSKQNGKSSAWIIILIVVAICVVFVIQKYSKSRTETTNTGSNNPNVHRASDRIKVDSNRNDEGHQNNSNLDAESSNLSDDQTPDMKEEEKNTDGEDSNL